MSTDFYVYETQAEAKGDIGMNERLKRCEACKDPFRWDGEIVIVNDELYHKECVTLYPQGYVAMLDDEVLGETENDEGSEAYDVLDEGEYLDD